MHFRQETCSCSFIINHKKRCNFISRSLNKHFVLIRIGTKVWEEIEYFCQNVFHVLRTYTKYASFLLDFGSECYKEFTKKFCAKHNSDAIWRNIFLFKKENLNLETSYMSITFVNKHFLMRWCVYEKQTS